MGFAEGQLVQTEGGNAAPVEEVPEGERVLCRDKEDFTRVSFVPVTLALRPDKLKKVVMVKVRPEGADESGKDDLSLVVTRNHRLLSDSVGGEVRAKDVRRGSAMRVVGEHGGTLTAHVVSVETGLGKQRVHSLHTASDTLVVNQVVVSCNDGMASKMTSGMLRLGKALGGSDGEQSVRDTIHEVRDLFSGSK